MTLPHGADICDPNLATHNYERLRANALGLINRAPEFTLFLRHGMSAWLRALAAPGAVRRKMRQEAGPVLTGSDVNMPGAALASILTDAILNAAGRARAARGDP